MSRKEFQKRNEEFICLKCGVKNAPASKSTRNHCFSCLYSLHVDEETPGDRQSDCKGLMAPVMLDYRGNKGFMILHKCEKCGKEMFNKAAPDDRLDSKYL